MTGRATLYRLFGLAVRSDLELPELPAAAEEAVADVEVRLAAPGAAGPDEGSVTLEDGALMLAVAGIGRYRVRDGREIVVEPAPEASGRNVRLFLLGSAFGALLHQRGLLPLHANAVEVEGRAIAFLGPSGAGKSTLAGWFHRRGLRVLADDVCVVGFGEGGEPFVQGGLPRLRLWRDALERDGRSPGNFELSYDGADKYDVPTGEDPLLGPLPLAQLYLLARAEEGAEPSIGPVTGAAAAAVLMANTYRAGFVRLLGATERHLRDCAALAERAPLFRAERRWGTDRFEAEARRLEAHARAILGGGAPGEAGFP